MILNHPDVIGFIHLNKDIITKALLPKKVVNFKATTRANKKVVVATSGDTEEYTLFCVLEKALLSNGLYFTNLKKFLEGTSSIPVGKCLKENEKNYRPYLTIIHLKQK